ncbi:putative hydrolase of the HAD superfamily [Malonomonas rubra DSM 5091]|uniref:Putative hydrolase of the HAD superfamily n=1 Tax=Malonomonas rubra DSM 5091 TaxID=1122189 RepID=A0A1M6JA64_MALRU|nr:HAD family phosphatase [Malonomonas rubra]SHJ43597.1 putative hydrolase of the HAD superfamily [Malonomonas rubra DSM 5091]
MAQVSDVVFDVGRVLIDFSYDNFAETLRQHGLSCKGPEDFLEHVDLIAYEHGEISTEAFLQQINSLLAEPMPFDELKNAWNNLFSPIREMLAVAGVLKKHCGVYLLSNTSELHWQYLQDAFGLDKVCHDRLASFEVGVMKPAPAIFSAACNRFDLHPETTVFIDDIEDNVRGAVACGWHGIWHRDIDTSKAELQRLTGIEL